jgi:phosphatidylglycerol:prolipoprotein diacylglycerol transferase
LAVTFFDPQSLAVLGVPLHPVKLYESFANLLLFLFLSFYWPHRRYDGQVFWFYALLYSFIRFFLEFLRGDSRGFVIPSLLSTSQGLSILLAGASLIMLLRLRRRGHDG